MLSVVREGPLMFNCVVNGPWCMAQNEAYAHTIFLARKSVAVCRLCHLLCPLGLCVTLSVAWEDGGHSKNIN